jgi:hypothetical protein
VKLTLILMLCILVPTLSCGGGNSSSSTPAAMSGNWQFTLTRHNSTQPWVFSGFLLQTGNNITGSFVLGAGCAGVGPVSGSFDGQNLQLNVGEFGQDFSLTAKLSTASFSGPSLAGQFSTLQGGCTGFSSAGTWTAVRIAPLAGAFHGTLVSTTNGTINVTGSLTQGANIGASNATVTGTITASGSPRFCSYLSTATITGTISGGSLILALQGPDGSQIGQIPAPIPAPGAIITPDATSLTSSYVFPAISSGCIGDQGSLTVTFP